MAEDSHRLAIQRASISATARAVRTGHAGRRAKNIAVGRALGKAGFCSRLWK